MSAVETRKMISNSALLEDLIAKGLIRIRDSEIFKVIPAALPESVCLSKIDGMLLGLAIGDALGATSEGMTSDERYKKCGEIRDYYPGKRNDYKNIGVPTDDSQLAFRTLDQLINDGELVPDRLATRFCKHRIFGIGTTTKTFVTPTPIMLPAWPTCIFCGICFRCRMLRNLSGGWIPSVPLPANSKEKLSTRPVTRGFHTRVHFGNS